MKNRTSFEHFFPEAVAGSDAERIAELEQKIRNLEYATKMRDDHRAALEKQNAELRMLLANHIGGSLLYTDDGELQDNSQHPAIDFKRDSPEQITLKIARRAALQPSTQEVSK